MRLTFDNDWHATVTGDPLPISPRFSGNSVDIADYADVEERGRFFAAIFGSQEWLWDTPDILRFDSDSRKLNGAEFQLPGESASVEDSARVPVLPSVRPGGLRADEVRDFRLETCEVLCRAPWDAVLTGLRDLDVLDEPLQARVGIAPDVALLVQHGTVVGWSLTDPARYLTQVFAAPGPNPSFPATRRLLTECLDLITAPVIDDVMDGEPEALARLRATKHALRAQHEDRPRADVLLALIANLVTDHANW